MKAVAAAIAGLMRFDGPFTVEGVEVTADDVIVTRAPKEGLVVASEGAIVVGLETALTPALIAEGRAQVMKLRQQERMIRNPEIRKQNTAICDTASKILQVLREKPESVTHARRFLNYYLPTQSVILEKYVRVESSGVPHEELAGKVLTHLKDIDLAMKKLYDSLFAGDILDLSVEMEVMTAMCKQDGLLADEEIPVQTEEGQVALRL
jgi:hypothetical protein